MRLRHAAWSFAAALLAAGCGTTDKPDQKPPSVTSSAVNSPTSSTTQEVSPLPTVQNRSPSPDVTASGVNYGHPVDVAKAFVSAYHTYDWQSQNTLDPVGRVAPYAAPTCLEKLRPLSAAFPARITASRETSRLTVRSAGTEGDAPASPDDAYVVVTYTQLTTNETADGPVTNTGEGAWSLHLTRINQMWRVAAIVAQS